MKISNIEKTIVTFLFALTIFGAYMIQVTAPFEYPSESFAADKDNKIWYILMHIGMAMGLYFLASIFGKKRYIFTIAAFSGLGILMFDMFVDYDLHAFFTGGLFVLVSYGTMIYINKFLKITSYVLLPLCAIGFILAIINPLILFTVYQIETIIQITLALLLLTDLWMFQKYRHDRQF